MTIKQVTILHSALQLFADEGYNFTTTKRVAVAAGVSEGLIFRHFGSKGGLLKAVLELGEVRVKSLYTSILEEADPRTIIRKSISIPFEVPPSDYPFWRLQYKLKWELNLSADDKMKPLEQTLTIAFRALGTPDPEREAKHLLRVIDAIGGDILKGSLTDLEDTTQWLMLKYGV